MTESEGNVNGAIDIRVRSADNQKRRRHKRLMLSLTKPSYTLKLGSRRVHHEHRIKLQHLLSKLMRQQNWVGASGVLSTLLKATCEERSLQMNRWKYWVAMELLKHVESDAATYSKGIEDLYYTWMGKIQSWKNTALRDKNAKLESILSILAHSTRMPSVVPTLTRVQGGHEVLTPEEWIVSRKLKEAYLDACSLAMKSEYPTDPLSNLVVGMTFYEHWYSTLPKELQLTKIQTESYGQELFLPIRFSSSPHMVNCQSSYRRFFDGTYKKALEHLEFALWSAPPVSEAALLPLIQLLLLRDILVYGEIDEALAVLEKSCNESNSVLPLRLRSHLWESFCANDADKVAMYIEDVLEKDPACKNSVARLVRLYQEGDYAPERLVEMIALHLEATYPDPDTWREFASCFLKLSRCEEDTTSMFVDGDKIERNQTGIHKSEIPLMFIRGMSGKTWKLRCKWWLNRYFSKDILASEMSTGDLQLITYKAACVSHLYGKEFEYLTKVNTCLDEHDDEALLNFLHPHINNSMGIYSNSLGK